MMILEARKVEDCFDGSRVYVYRVDEPWRRETIAQLGALGELDYYPEFPRPFFRLRGRHGMQVKGVEGNDTCRVVLPRREQAELQRSLESALTAIRARP